MALSKEEKARRAIARQRTHYAKLVEGFNMASAAPLEALFPIGSKHLPEEGLTPTDQIAVDAIEGAI